MYNVGAGLSSNVDARPLLGFIGDLTQEFVKTDKLWTVAMFDNRFSLPAGPQWCGNILFALKQSKCQYDLDWMNNIIVLQNINFNTIAMHYVLL